MTFTRHGIALILVSLVALTALTCKNQQQSNSNRPASIEAPKPGKWIAQYRSPASLSFNEVNLSRFYYSGISVVSPDIVFVCGDVPLSQTGEESVAMILRTTDGGQQWNEKPIELPGIRIPTLNSIHFISPDVGWAVGAWTLGADQPRSGVVLKTTDGGSSWTATKLSQKQVPTTVFFADADTGWMGGATPPRGEEEGVGGASAILATTDGGSTWQTSYNIPVSIYRVFFVDKTYGWAAGSKGMIYRTTDGGRTWDSLRTEIEMEDGPIDLKGEGVKQYAVRGLHFTDKDNGFAGATSTEEAAEGRMLGTSNGGVTWRRVWIVKGGGVRDVFFLNQNEGWGLTDDTQYIYHTVDGGRTWFSEPKVFEQNLQLSRVGASDPAHAWAVGGGAIFFRVSE